VCALYRARVSIYLFLDERAAGKQYVTPRLAARGWRYHPRLACVRISPSPLA